VVERSPPSPELPDRSLYQDRDAIAGIVTEEGVLFLEEGSVFAYEESPIEDAYPWRPLASLCARRSRFALE
jgi:hypothetical protein